MKRASGLSRFGKRVRTAIASSSTRASRVLAARRSLLRRQRGYVATTGFYGRYTGPAAEMKFFDTVEAAATGAVAGTISIGSVNIVPQDDTQSGRIGRKITIKRLQVRGQLVLPATTVAADTTDKIRVMFIQDMQTNGASPTVATILETADINSYLNMANSSRFKVLSDKIYTLNATAGGAPTGTPSFGSVTRNYAIYKKCNIIIEYDNSAATGAIATQRTNNILCMCISLNAKVTHACTVRIRYSDT